MNKSTYYSTTSYNLLIRNTSSDKMNTDKRSELSKIKYLIKKKVEDHISKLREGLVMPEADFIKVCQLFCKEQYCDVTEERSISAICGYPMCGKSISRPTNAAKYKLTGTHILEASERAKFCSDNCYFGSDFLNSQLEDQPAWNVLGRQPKPIKLFSHLSAAERVSFKMATAVGSNRKCSNEQIEEIIERRKTKLNLPQQEETTLISNENNKLKESETEQLSKTLEQVEVQTDVQPIEINKTDLSKDEDDNQKVNDLSRPEKIIEIVKEWSSRMDYYHCVKGSKQLKSSEAAEENRIEILSIVDCSKVQVLRRGIVKERMKQAFKSLPNGLSRQLPKTGVLDDFSELLGYLEFSNTNILLDTIEWKIIALALLRVFTLKDELVKEIAFSPEYEVTADSFQMTVDQMDAIADVFMHGYEFYVLGGGE